MDVRIFNERERKGNIMKRIIAFTLMLVMMLSVVPAYAATADATLNTTSGKVFVEGTVSDPALVENGISILLKKKNAEETDEGFIGYANQIKVDEIGNYSVEFDFSKNINEYELLVFNGDTNLTDTVTVATVKSMYLTDAELSFSETDSTVTLTAELTNSPTAADFDCIAIIVGYDADGKMICMETSREVSFAKGNQQTVTATATLNRPVAFAKGFVWTSLTQMVPLCEPKSKFDKVVAYSWSLAGDDAENVHPMFYLYGGEKGSRPEDPNKETIAFLYDGNYATEAQKMKAYMESRPEEGRVVIPHFGKIIFNLDSERPNTFDNWFWWDAGIDEAIRRLDEFFKAYKAIDGPEIKGMFFDFEAGCDYSNISWGSVGGDTQLTRDELVAVYDQVIADPRYETDIKQRLDEMGFEFYNGNDYNELRYYYINESAHREAFYIGQAFASKRKAEYLNEIYEAVKKHYPDIIFSNYGSYNRVDADVKLEVMNASWYNAVPEKSERKAAEIGTHMSPTFYGQMSMTDRDVGVVAYTGYAHGTTFKKTPFNAALAVLQRMQRATAYHDDQMIMPWVMPYTSDYSAASPTPYSSTEYYKELMLQLGLCNARAFLFFNNAVRTPELDVMGENALMSDLMDELNYFIGYSGKKSLVETPVSGNTRYMLSGMKANGQNVWRIAPDIYTPDGNGGHVTKESFLVDAENLVFRIGNQCIDFPEGSRIVEYENELSSVGYWVISPLGTRPTEYIEANYDAPLATDYEYVYGAELEKLKEEMGI